MNESSTSSHEGAARRLAWWLHQPANRACADCRMILLDTTEVYVSLSPPPTSNTAIPARYNHFHANHQQFAPPGAASLSVDAAAATAASSTTTAKAPPMDPALQATQRTGGHGVFVCAMCAAAHKLLGEDTCLVHPVVQADVWMENSVVVSAENNHERSSSSSLHTATLPADHVWQMLEGGNARARTVLEAYLPVHWQRLVIKGNSNNNNNNHNTASIAERLSFVRAKYQALAFCLPPPGPLAPRAWRSIVDRHAVEWQGLWNPRQLSLLHSPLNFLYHANESSLSPGSLRHLLVDHKAQLPNRLVDHFCVVDHSVALDPTFAREYTERRHAANRNNHHNPFHDDNNDDNNNNINPEDVLLQPVVTDCYPPRNAHADMEFPEMLGHFLFPEGYRPARQPQAPTFFTFVLTTADGNRLYGGCLRIYDKSYEAQAVLGPAFGKMDAPLPSSSSTWGDTAIVYLPKCLVLLSHYPFFDLWRKALLALYRIVLIEAPLPIERFLANFCTEVPVPPPGVVQVRYGFTTNEVWHIERPPENVLPMANFSFRPLFASLSVTNVMVVMGCLMQEAKVALLSRHYALLTPVAEALMSLLFPFRWQGLYIPILPYAMRDVLDSPVPFLIGLHSRYLRSMPTSYRPKGVVYVDLDLDVVHLGLNDDAAYGPRETPSLPEKHAAKLRAKLTTYATPAYLIPDSNRVGTITYGDDEKLLPMEHREGYARVSPEMSRWRTRRRDYFRAVDKAYTNVQLMQPMTGFLSEQGQYHGGQSTPTVSGVPRGSRIRALLRLRSQQSSVGSHSSADDDSGYDDSPNESLLDLQDPKGFSTVEIRSAFLRFFVSILRDYRSFMGIQDFDSEAFVANQKLSPANRGFVLTLTQTQMFQRFLQERRESPHDPECVFFDESINAKINRSKFTSLARGKRDTTFIDDKSKTVTDIYTPPPPSNFGLPHRTYNYGSFPDLDYSLFGETRKPREWPSKPSTLRSIRNSHIPVRKPIHSFATISIGGKSTKNVTPSTPLAQSASDKEDARPVRTLEEAIEFLSRPYAGRPERKSGKGSLDATGSSSSDLTLSSKFGLATDQMSSAEEVVLNSRRKVAILLGIFTELQALARGHISRNPRLRKAILETKSVHGESEKEEQVARQHKAAAVISQVVGIARARQRFLQSRGAAILIQAHVRRRRAEHVYALVRKAVARLQAFARYLRVQKQLKLLLKQRMKVYTPQIFALWKRTHTSLAFRTNFWRYTKSYSLIHHGIVETELRRLLREVNASDDARLTNPDMNRLIRESDRLGMSVYLLRHCAVLDTSFSGGERDSLRASYSSWSDGQAEESVVAGSALARLTAERTQIYEKLTTASGTKQEVADSLYEQFHVSLKDKRRKVALTNQVWNRYSLADESVKLMYLLFPELKHSTNIKFAAASRKGIRRIGGVVIPEPLEEPMWSHTFFNQRIRQNLAEIASVAMLYLPRRYDTYHSPEAVAQAKWGQAMTAAHGCSSWKECRLQLMKSMVWSC